MNLCSTSCCTRLNLTNLHASFFKGIRHFILILEEDSLVYELNRTRSVDVADGEATRVPSTPDALPPDIDEKDKDLKNLEGELPW